MILEAILLAAAASPAAPPRASPAPITCTLPIPPQLPPFAPGITLIQAQASCGAHTAHVSILMVDMTTEGRSVRTTVPPAIAPLSATNTANVGSSFPLMLPTAALSGGQSGNFMPQAAVNANLFTNCCSYTPQDWKYPGTFLLGLQITNGRVNVPLLANGYTPCAQQGAACFASEFDATLLIDGANNVTIRRIDTLADLNALPDIVTAVTGSHMLVFDKQVVAKLCPTGGCGGEFYGPNARTAAGVIGTGTLVIVAVDRGGPSTGLQLDELATLLSANLHVDAAINLDGGGSTTMAIVRQGVPTIVNNPADTGPNGCTVQGPNGNCERYVGDALVVGVTQSGAAKRRPQPALRISPGGVKRKRR